MAAPTIARDETAARASRAVLAAVFAGCPERDFAVRLWNGDIWSPAPEQTPRFTIVLNHPGALRRMFLPPSELVLGEAFVHGDFDVEGDLVVCTGLADVVAPLFTDPRRWPPLARLLLSLPNSRLADPGWRGGAQLHGELHSSHRDQQAVVYHYDLPGEFYALFLDKYMQYSCAYFPTGEEGLDAAQEAKLEHICRKLRLQRGERLLDIGCGWGGLISFAAERYGVEALGITLSPSQAAMAKWRIQQMGLGDRCRVDLRDYRSLGPWERFDKIVSVGMFEHVGRATLPQYFQQAYTLLAPGGLFLNHGIAGVHMAQAGPLGNVARRLQEMRGDFMHKYVFPDAQLVPVSETNDLAERAGFEVRDVESLREHYARTLRHWLHNLETKREEALRLVDQPTYRVWRLYIAGCAHAFNTARLNVYQTLLVKPDEKGRSGLPWSRAYIYS